jgi:hypothetical protein
MPNYRVYCYDGGGRLWTADNIDAADDAQAIALAEAMSDAVKCEVWEGSRLVATIPRPSNAD